MNIVKKLVPISLLMLPLAVSAKQDATAQLTDMLESMNNQLAMQGMNYRVGMVEALVNSDGKQNSITVIAKDVGNKRLAFQFVPFDERREGWSGPVDGDMDDITYVIDMTADAMPPLGGLTEPETTEAIRNAMMSWDNVKCSNLPLTENASGADIGLIAWLNGLGGSPVVAADIQHAGWTDINFAGSVLAATFTFGWIEDGEWTDIDSDGYNDAALREIYYDPDYVWSIDANFDVETIALHEAGHALSQGHFGHVFINKKGVKAAPRAIMNAVYLGVQQELLGTDNGGHCGMWANWPNR